MIVALPGLFSYLFFFIYMYAVSTQGCKTAKTHISDLIRPVMLRLTSAFAGRTRHLIGFAMSQLNLLFLLLLFLKGHKSKTDVKNKCVSYHFARGESYNSRKPEAHPKIVNLKLKNFQIKKTKKLQVLNFIPLS